MTSSHGIALVVAVAALAACTTVLNIDDGGPAPPLDGGSSDGRGETSSTAPAVLASDLAETTDLVVFDRYVYFRRDTAAGAAILRVPKTGGKPEEVASGGLVVAPSNLAATAAGVFWGGASRLPVSAGLRFHDGKIPPEERAGDPPPSWIAAQGESFFFITQEDPALVWSGNPFLAPSAVISTTEHAFALATDGKHLFIATSSPAADPEPPPRVIRAELDGTGQRSFLVGGEPVTALAAAPGRVAWATPSGVTTAAPNDFPASATALSSETDIVGITIDERVGAYYLLSRSGGVFDGAYGVTTRPVSGVPPCAAGRAITHDDTDLYVACSTSILRFPLTR